MRYLEDFNIFQLYIYIFGIVPYNKLVDFIPLSMRKKNNLIFFKHFAVNFFKYIN